MEFPQAPQAQEQLLLLIESVRPVLAIFRAVALGVQRGQAESLQPDGSGGSGCAWVGGAANTDAIASKSEQ